jgi:hypothetical protein
MKCTVHIWKSIDSEGTHFLLRLRPLYSVERNRSVETFRNERSLSRRLLAIGFSEDSRRTSLANLRSDSSAMWSHMEIAEGIFESFGQSAGHPLSLAITAA